MSKARDLQAQSQDVMKILFLESHGLRSPLTAIRWAAGRLKRETAGPLTPEQRYLVDHIYGNTKRLTAALESMLLIARMEEGAYAPGRQELCTVRLLESARERMSGERNARLQLHVPHLHFQGDRDIIDMILKDIITVFTEKAEAEPRTVVVEASQQQDTLLFTFRSSFLLPALQRGSSGPEAVRVIGGIPGLMLSMADEMAKKAGGSVELEEMITGEFVTDGTVELVDTPADECRIAFRYPAAVIPVEGECNIHGK